jgi:hypothetical protein
MTIGKSFGPSPLFKAIDKRMYKLALLLKQKGAASGRYRT